MSHGTHTNDSCHVHEHMNHTNNHILVNESHIQSHPSHILVDFISLIWCMLLKPRSLCVAVCRSMLQCVTACCTHMTVCCWRRAACTHVNGLHFLGHLSLLQCDAVWCSVMQCDAACCSVMQCAAACCSVLQSLAVCCSVWHLSHVSHLLEEMPCDAVCCSMLQCIAVHCSALQCVAERCSF